MARGLPRTLQRAAARAAGAVAPATGLTVKIDWQGGSYRAVFTLKDMAITVTDALAYASQKLFTFKEGKVRLKGGTASLAFAVTTTRASTINDSAAMDWSIGSAAASSSTLATTMVDFIAKQDKTLDGTGSAYTTAQAADFAAAATFDGTSAAKAIYLNVAFPTATDIDADGTLTVSGTLTLLFELWGDNA